LSEPILDVVLDFTRAQFDEIFVHEYPFGCVAPVDLASIS
jgi:hypothetical protein